MTHVMVDIEAMSSSADAAVSSIGMVVFDPTLGVREGEKMPTDPATTFYVNVDLQSAIDEGFAVSGKTVYWWLGREGKRSPSSTAVQALWNPSPVPIRAAFASLRKWWKTLPAGNNYLWSHATYDAAVLEYSFERLDGKPPWGYQHARDMRTIIHMAYGDERIPAPPKDAPEGHTALYDAWRQTIMVRRCYQKLGLHT